VESEVAHQPLVSECQAVSPVVAGGLGSRCKWRGGGIAPTIPSL